MCWASRRYALPAFAAAAQALAARRRYLLLAGRSAACPQAAVVAVDRWDRQTDGRPAVVDPAPHKPTKCSVIFESEE